MCFEIGNKVAVIDDVINGEVTKVVDKQVFIKDAQGMEYRFSKEELVKLGVEQKELSKYIDIKHEAQYKVFVKKKRTTSPFKKTKKEIVMEVDLHIEKLLKSTQHMDSYDILNYQLEIARRKIEYGLSKKISKIVFIHGVGAGVLKTELGYLFNKYPVDYQDASYTKYGLGATEVYIYQNN